MIEVANVGKIHGLNRFKNSPSNLGGTEKFQISPNAEHEIKSEGNAE